MLGKLISKVFGGGGSGDDYVAAAEIQAKAIREASGIQADQAGKTLAFQKAVYESQKALNAPWVKSGRRAIEGMERISAGGAEKEALAQLRSELKDLPSVARFEDYEGRIPEVRSAIDHVLSFKDSVREGMGWEDPDFDFTYRRGIRALDRSHARMGDLGSGAAVRDNIEFAQEHAQTYYDRAHRRAMDEGRLMEASDTAGRNRFLEDYDRRRTSDMGEYDRSLNRVLTRFDAGRMTRDETYGRLRDRAGYGQQAVARTTQLGTDFSRMHSDTILGQGDARAGGIAGAATARAQGLVDAEEARRAQMRDILGAAGQAAGAYAGYKRGAA